MENNKITSMPILDNGELFGIINVHDILIQGIK